MPSTQLHAIAQQMVAPHKGILAADESNSTAGKRLASIHLESTEENRRKYRELFLSTEGIEAYLSGVILYDETIHQKTSDGVSFVELLQKKGILPGIKVDMGLCDLPNFPGEEFTQGLDGLSGRLKAYYDLGARFTKWRSMIHVGEGLPTDVALHSNLHAMSLYAALSQAAGLVPMVEPEVLIDGEHTIEQSEEVTRKTLKTLFQLLSYFKVDLQGTILKTSMVISGKSCLNRADAATVGTMTARCLKESVPAELAGIVFLSGGQSPEEATENLNEIVKAGKALGCPWEMTFSYARALQGPSLELWAGKEENCPAAREKFLERLKANSAARSGKYEGMRGDRAHESLKKKPEHHEVERSAFLKN